MESQLERNLSLDWSGTRDHGSHGQAPPQFWSCGALDAGQSLGLHGRRSGHQHRSDDGRLQHGSWDACARRLLGSRAFSLLLLAEWKLTSISTQFSAVQGVTLSPMFFLNPAILSRAGLYTVGALGAFFSLFSNRSS